MWGLVLGASWRWDRRAGARVGEALPNPKSLWPNGNRNPSARLPTVWNASPNTGRDGLVGRELPSHCIRQVGSQPGAEGPAAAGQVLASGKGSGLGGAPLRAACPLSAGLCQSLSSQGHPWSWLLIGGSAGTAHGTPARPPARESALAPLGPGPPCGDRRGMRTCPRPFTEGSGRRAASSHS